MDPRRALVFREVARAGSLAGAARALGWTQPAVSQHVRRLERELGTPLVVRAGRGVALTEAGAVLLRHAEGIASRIDAATEEIAALRDLRSGRVRLAAFPSACATLVPPALAALAAAHPGIDVRLTELEPPEALTRLHSGEDDLAIVFGFASDDADPLTPPSAAARARGGDPLAGPDAGVARRPRAASRSADLEVELLLTEPLSAVVPREHPAAEAGEVALGELAGERWIAGCERCRAHLLASAARAGFAPDVRHSTDDYVVVQTLVARGLGVAQLPALALAAFRHPGVAVVPLTGVAPRTVLLAHRPDAADVPALAVARRLLQQAPADLAGR